VSAVPGAPRRALRGFDPFRILSASERRRHLDEFKRFLEQRDGELDIAGRTLSQRESFFKDLESKPVAWDGEIDHAGFFQHFRGTGTPDIDPQTVWLIAVAKANEAESWGVELEIDRFLTRGVARADVRELFIVLEELYHTRILLEACRTCGLDVEIQEPPWHRRWMIRAIFYMPERIRWIPVLCGEALAAVVLKLLYDRCDLFAEQPEVEERLKSLLGEIWIDETLHVAYLRAKLGPMSVRASRLLLPVVVLALMKDVPQLRKLGCTLGELFRRARTALEIPPAIEWMEADPTADA